MILRHVAAAAVVTACAAVSGCATLTPGSDAMTYAQRRAYLSGLEAWDLRGRIAIRNGERAFQGRFLWSQRAESLELTVRSPIGTNVLRVSGPVDRLTLEARGESHELKDPELQLSTLVGWWLPVTSFRSWLLGIPDPDYDVRERLGADGLLDAIDQRLWHIDVASYRLAAGVLVPERIELAHGDLDLRVFVDSFDPTP